MYALQSAGGIAGGIAQSGLGTVATVVATGVLALVVAAFVYLALAPHVSSSWTEGFGDAHIGVTESASDASSAAAADD